MNLDNKIQNESIGNKIVGKIPGYFSLVRCLRSLKGACLGCGSKETEERTMTSKNRARSVTYDYCKNCDKIVRIKKTFNL